MIITPIPSVHGHFVSFIMKSPPDTLAVSWHRKLISLLIILNHELQLFFAFDSTKKNYSHNKSVKVCWTVSTVHQSDWHVHSFIDSWLPFLACHFIHWSFHLGELPLIWTSFSWLAYIFAITPSREKIYSSLLPLTF